MLDTWDQRARRDNIKVTKISFPVPTTTLSELTTRIEQAVTPRTKVIHICHVTNLTGQLFPVRDIARMARSKGILTIVDGAHAFAHFPFALRDLECDCYGTSLHKWLLAPVGTGFLYMRRENIEKIWPLTPAGVAKSKDIRKFEEVGTHPAANHNAIAEALVFHQGIGVERRAARMRYLTDRWATRLEKHPRVKILTSRAAEPVVGARQHQPARRRFAEGLRSRCGRSTGSSRRPSSTPSIRACASRRTSTRRCRSSTPSVKRLKSC